MADTREDRKKLIAAKRKNKDPLDQEGVTDYAPGNGAKKAVMDMTGVTDKAPGQSPEDYNKEMAELERKRKEREEGQWDNKITKVAKGIDEFFYGKRKK